jgi:CheY-like chemotaxis protein
MNPACQLLGDSLPKVLVVDDEPGMSAFVVEALECCTARVRAAASAP